MINDSDMHREEGVAKGMAPKILFINDNTAHVNWGAQASPPALYHIIQEAIPGCRIDTLSHAWLARSHLRRLRSCLGGQFIREEKWPAPCRRFLYRLSRQIGFYPTVADDFDGYADEWMNDRCGPIAEEFLLKARQADSVIYNGENSIYRNTPEGCHGVFLLFLAKTRLRKSCGIINHTAHLNDVRPILSGMVKKVFPFLDIVGVREPASLRMLKTIGIENAELFPDAVFAQNPGKFPSDHVSDWLRSNHVESGNYFCLSASGLPVSMPRGSMDGAMTHLVRDLKSLGYQAVLVAKDPWCLPLAEVARRTDSLFFGPEHDYPDLWHLFSKAAFLVSGHYHYVIFAAMTGCPFIPLSVNNHKMQGVCEHLEWHRTIPFDATSLEPCRHQILNEARLLLEKRIELGEHLRLVSGRLCEETRRLGDRIASISRSYETKRSDGDVHEQS